MFIELVDALRCLAQHEETWLVAAVDRMDGRHIVDGTLGCPICRREYRIRNGVAWFTAAGEADAQQRLTPVVPTGDDARITRAAALLGLADGGGIVALGGVWTETADAIAALGVAHVVVLNSAIADGSPQEVSALAVDDRLPFSQGILRAVALGRGIANEPLLASAAVSLRGRGRLVAPADTPLPEGITELARDSEDWVGERAAVPSPPVTLRSARR